MNDIEERFEAELNKLSAINRVNCEIFERLKPMKKEDKIVVKIFHNISLSRNILTFQFEEEQIQMKPLGEIFKKCPNLFKDELPTGVDYIDLENTITQLSLINPKKGMGLLEKWKVKKKIFSFGFFFREAIFLPFEKNAFQDAQQCLGSVEIEMRDKTKLSSQCLSFFEIESVLEGDGMYVKLTPKGDLLSNFSFSLKCQEETIEDLQHLSVFIKKRFTLGKPREKKKKIRKNSKINVNGNQISCEQRWGNLIFDVKGFAEDFYSEITVIYHRGAGHIRFGLCGLILTWKTTILEDLIQFTFVQEILFKATSMDRRLKGVQP